ncbi:MAG: proline dehydrogenase family protein [Thermoanaerobaculia bacterium]
MSLFNRLVVTTLPLVPKFIVGRVASRYVAGETLDDAIAVIRRLNSEGAMATVDLLGEEIEERHQATAALDGYLRLLDAIVDNDLDCHISVKPTLLGLMIEEKFCLEHCERLVERAAAKDIFVRLDMEDRHCTDGTLRVYRALHPLRGHVGVVFQSYMRRTLADIAGLPEDGANVRLCKGIYIEPRTAAWKGVETVRLNFLAALEKLFRQGVYVGIATHDEYLICGAVALIDRLGIAKDRYEFQMLLGVESQLRKILIEGGHRMRVYVPFGRDWYLYSIRRLRENPAVAGHVMRAMLRGQ